MFFIPCFILLCFSFSLTARPQSLQLDVKAEAAILMNAENGAILFEKNGNALHYPASTTKIATALYALQKVADKMGETIVAEQDCIGTVKEEAIRRSNYTLPSYLLIPDGSHIGIKRGEILSLRDLFYGMMVASGDDAANIIAKYSSGTIPKFIEEMNEYVRGLGCSSTTFYNPHGLHHPNQRTTAFDLALLTIKALENPFFCELVRTVHYVRPKTNKQESTTLIQTNRLMRSGPFYYSKAIGVKTGYYSLAGNNLVAAAKDGNRMLIAVLLKVKERKDIFIDAKKLFEAAFSQPKVQRVLLHRGIQKFALNLSGGEKPIPTFIDQDVTIEYYPAEEAFLKCMVSWNKDLKFPIRKDQMIGDVILEFDSGQLYRKIPLYAHQEVKLSWSYWFKSLFLGKWENFGLFKFLIPIIPFSIMTIFLLRRRKH